MTVHAQNSCTLSHITDVQAVYTYYYLASSDITSNMAPKDNVNAPGASTIRVTYDGVNYDWTLVEPSLNIIDDVIQTAVGKLYCIECTLFSDTTYDWGPLMTSSTYAAAKAAYNLSTQAVQTASDAYGIAVGVNQHFWTIAEDYAVGIPAGSYITDTAIDTFKSQKTGGNILTRSDGIWIRNGVKILSSLTGQALTFYNPSTTSQGGKAIELTSSALTFYDPYYHEASMVLTKDSLAFNKPNSTVAAATLTSNGLVLSKGGIEAGEAGQTGFIYLSTEDYPLKDTQSSPTVAGLTINEYTPSAAGTDGRENDDPAWRQIIGTKFGVDSEGNLYASDVNIKGKITATSGAIGGANITASNLYGNTRSAYNSGNGYYLGSDGKFGVGTSSNYLTFDGTNVNIKGGITATSLTIDSGATVSGVVVPSDISDMATKTQTDWSVIVTTTGTPNFATPSVTLKATVYHRGTIATTGFTRAWYKNGTGDSLGSGETITVTDIDAYYVCIISES